MVRIHAAALLWAWAQISSGGNSGASAGSDTRALLTLLCTHEHDASRTSLAHLLMPAIHQTSWQANSANYFAFRACLVRVRVKLFGVLRRTRRSCLRALFGRNASKTEEASAQKRLT